jgi:predicted kinase
MTCNTVYVRYSSRLKEALTAHICSLLSKGISVVLDFSGNTRTQRDWFRELFEQAITDHELHYMDATDELCKRQLRQQSKGVGGAAFTSNAEFDAMTKYFQAPSDDENFNVILHRQL